jgi:hypothetical protein
MGDGRWDPSAYLGYRSRVSGKSTDDLFRTAAKARTTSRFGTRGLADRLDPKGIQLRESRDSPSNPRSTPIAVASDVTGSMGMLARLIAQSGLGVLAEETLRRKPVTDPHLMFMAIGDVHCDHAPLQVTQFEADIRITEQIEDFYIEHGGGDNDSESYNLPWYFMGMHTVTDAFEKRRKKGYLFTVGDERAPEPLTAAQIEGVLGTAPQRDFTNEELLRMAGRMYHVFHVIVEQGSHASAYPRQVRDSWTRLLGQRVIRLCDYTKLAEVIVSTIEVNEGRAADEVAASWKGDTALVVRRAVTDLAKRGAGGGLVTF